MTRLLSWLRRFFRNDAELAEHATQAWNRDVRNRSIMANIDRSVEALDEVIRQMDRLNDREGQNP